VLDLTFAGDHERGEREGGKKDCARFEPAEEHCGFHGKLS